MQWQLFLGAVLSIDLCFDHVLLTNQKSGWLLIAAEWKKRKNGWSSGMVSENILKQNRGQKFKMGFFWTFVVFGHHLIFICFILLQLWKTRSSMQKWNTTSSPPGHEEGKLAYEGWLDDPPSTLFKPGVFSYMFFVGGVLWFVVRKFSEVINRIRTCGENVSKWYSR